MRPSMRRSFLAADFAPASYLITTQPYFWGLDSIPMVLGASLPLFSSSPVTDELFAALGVFLVAHPFFCLPAHLGDAAHAENEVETAVVEKGVV